jgi:hypothetical protein
MLALRAMRCKLRCCLRMGAAFDTVRMGSEILGGEKITSVGGDTPSLIFGADGFDDGHEERFIGEIQEFDTKSVGAQSAKALAADELEKERGGEAVLIGRFTITEDAQTNLFALFGGKLHEENGVMEFWSNGNFYWRRNASKLILLSPALSSLKQGGEGVCSPKNDGHIKMHSKFLILFIWRWCFSGG